MYSSSMVKDHHKDGYHYLDSTVYTAHSFLGTAAFSSGVSTKDIMGSANWTSTKTF